MTYIEAYNHYLSNTESKCDLVEEIIADSLRSIGLEHKENFSYNSFLENARIKVFNHSTTTSDLFSICKNALDKNNFTQAKMSILKSDSIDNTEYLISVDL